MSAVTCLANHLALFQGLQEIFGSRWSLEHALEPCMVHNPRINLIHTKIVLSDAHLCIEINLYTQLPPTCFGQPCRRLQGDKIQRLGTLKSIKCKCK
jgi:hypothetical protein